MTEPTVALTTDDRGVATLTLNRPDRHNAFDDAVIAGLKSALLRLGDDSAVRVVVLTGAGKSFSSGGDIEWMKSMAGYGEAQNYEDALQLAELLAVLDGLRKPTIARVNGAAFGGGVGLVAACDLAIADERARFALSEVRLGLVPAVISPYIIAALGPRQARRLFLTGEAFDAATALRLGLIDEVVSAEQLDASVDGQIALLLAGGPVAQAEAKDLVAMVTHSATSPENTLMRRTAEVIAQLRVSPEGQEGLAAFLEKRRPGWQDRE